MTRRAAKLTPDSRSAQELAKAFLEHELIPAGDISDCPSPSCKAREMIFSELAFDWHLRGILGSIMQDGASFGFAHQKDALRKKVDDIGDFAFGARQFMQHMCTLEQYGALKDFEKQTIGQYGLRILSNLRDKYTSARAIARFSDKHPAKEITADKKEVVQSVAAMHSVALNNIDKLENILRNIAAKLNITLVDPPGQGQSR